MFRSPTRSPRVLLIGLDAADPALLFKWAAEGVMPNLARLMANGVSGRLSTPAGMGDDATWSSFSTGLEPENHGRIDYRFIPAGQYTAQRFRDHHFRNRPFWEVLDDKGIRVAAIDVPKSPQGTLRYGVEINNFRVHGVDGGLRSHPPEIAACITSRFGQDPTDRPDSDRFLCAPGACEGASRAQLTGLLLTSIQQKAEVSRALMHQDFDLMITVFKEAHCAGHKLWPPDRDMQTVYRALDEALGGLIKQAGEHTTTIVFSTLGMGPNFHGNHLLDAVLRRLERRWLPIGTNLLIEAARLRHHLLRRTGRTSTDGGVGRRLMFVLPHNEISGAIRINVNGREPSGRVPAGTAWHRLCDQLEAELLALRNADTGGSVVREVIRFDRSTRGAQRSAMPDLLAVWQRDVPIHAVTSPSFGTLRQRSTGDSPGNHLEGGCFVAGRPCHSTALPARPDTSNHSIIDLAPTVASLFGIQLPAASGRVIETILNLSGTTMAGPARSALEAQRNSPHPEGRRRHSDA